MKLTTRSRYGLRAMTYIAKQEREGRPVPLSEMADALLLSESYLEQLLRLLKRDHCGRLPRRLYQLSYAPCDQSHERGHLSLH